MTAPTPRAHSDHMPACRLRPRFWQYSWPTLGEALRSLEDEGVVTRARGTGTFLSHRPRLRNNLDVNFGVTDAIRQAGREPGQRSAVTSIARPNSEESEALALQPGEQVV